MSTARYQEAVVFAAAAHAASTRPPCKHPGNALLYYFLREVRTARQAAAPDATDNLVSGLRAAEKGLADHPTRVVDLKTALAVKGIGPNIGKIAVDHLFAAYPPAPLDAGEAAAVEEAMACAKAQRQAASKKTGKKGRPSALDAASTESCERTSAPPQKKPAKEYVPAIGSANYAFLIVMYQAAVGPEQLCELTKSELMERAERSGLADRPIIGDAGAAVAGRPHNRGGERGPQRGPGGVNFYNGWSSFNPLLVHKHGLTATRSNPKLCSLTVKGMALAARLFEGALLRGAVAPLQAPRADDAVRQHAAQDAVSQLDPGSSSTDSDTCSSGADAPGRRPVRGSPSLLSQAQVCGASEERPGASWDSVVDLSQMDEDEGVPGSQRCPATHHPGPCASQPEALSQPLVERLAAALDRARMNGAVASLPVQPGATTCRPSPPPPPAGACVPDAAPPLPRAPAPLQAAATLAGAPPPRAASPPCAAGGCVAASERLPPLHPGAPFEAQYDIIFLLDAREVFTRAADQGRSEALAQHLARLRAMGLVVEERTLPAGDGLWIARSKADPTREWVLDYIMERKSYTDLIQSIRGDNRYESQKFALKRCGLRHVFYLLEGDPDMLPSPTEQKAVKTAAADMEIIDGFRILRSKNHVDTLRLLCTLTHHVIEACRARRGAPATAGPPAPDVLPTWSEFKTRRESLGRGSMSLADTWRLMLASVRGAGHEAVAAMVQRHATPAAMHAAMRAAQAGGGAAAARRLLAPLAPRPGSRAVGEGSAARVYDTLFALEDQAAGDGSVLARVDWGMGCG
ncbi:MUS81 [Auxenochlorella protothecoides x Auxenochlorella symbiontica]